MTTIRERQIWGIEAHHAMRRRQLALLSALATRDVTVHSVDKHQGVTCIAVGTNIFEVPLDDQMLPCVSVALADIIAKHASACA